MRVKKGLLILLFFIVIAIVWVIVLKAFLNVDEKQEISKHMQAGDAYLEKELYVRAIPEYEAARDVYVDEPTKDQIEQKLLQAYQGYGDMDAYISLVEERTKNGIASENELIEAANFEFDTYQITSALDLLKEGLSIVTDSEKLLELYEAHEFDHKTVKTTWVQVLPTAEGNYMPAYDGESWVYVDDGGHLIQELQYKMATPYDTDANGNHYAAVQIGEEHFVITEDGSWYGRDENSIDEIAYITNGRVVAKANGKYGYYDYDFNLLSEKHQYDFISRSSCQVVAVKDKDEWKLIKYDGSPLNDETYEDVAINSLGEAFAGDVAMVKSNGAWRLIDNEGNFLGDGTYFSARAPESSEYIAVENENEMWGFIDRDGNLVIDYNYEDAFSFSDGTAAVKDSLSWSYINRNGKKVIQDGFDEALPFHNRVAIVRLADAVDLLKLAYQSE